MADLEDRVSSFASRLAGLRPAKKVAGTPACAWGPCREPRRTNSKYCCDDHRNKNARQRYKLRQKGLRVK